MTTTSANTRQAASSLDAPVRVGIGSWVGAIVCTGILGFAWSIREEGYLDAATGLGYRLGIVGAAMMLLLLLYSARKRARMLGSWGPLPVWFRVHMWLGIAGPMAILLHSNLKLGSLNSNIALICMLLVAGSGIVGRVIYSKIHYGLYGRKLRLADKRTELTEEAGKLRPLLQAFPEVLAPIEKFEERHTPPPRSAMAALWRLATLSFRSGRLNRECEGLLDPVLFEERRASNDYVRHVRRVSEFSAYERVFRLWHAVHIPLFIMMILSLVLHVLAVHMY